MQEKKRKIVLAVGGTGGHLFPAEALASDLEGVDLLFAGAGLQKNPFFTTRKWPFADILSDNRSLYKIFRGTWQAIRLLRQFKPDLVVGFGSYHSLTVLLGALFLRIPVVLHEANAYPGRVVRLLSPFVQKTAIHFPETADVLRGESCLVGMPLRKGLKRDPRLREEAYSYFGLTKKSPTILIFGGSLGATNLNKLASLAAEGVEKEMQILHFTGKGKLQDVHYTRGAVVKEFETRMDLAYSIADFVISRSGASSLAEQLEFLVPGILIPYPAAADNHQEKNAKAFLAATGGGILLQEKGLTAAILHSAIKEWLDAPQKIEKMREMMKNSKKEETFTQLVKELW